MRLTTLILSRYGIFDSQRLAFDTRPGCINLVIAPNGGGKSILRQAFCDLLFGIHTQTPMGFRFGYPGMRLLAEAIGPDGAPFSFGRRKGQGNTLIDAAGIPIEAGVLARLLGHTDRSLLERLFALDTERLRSGGEELLASGGAMADALLAAGGLRRAREVRQQLETERDSQAPLRKAQAKPFYQALEKFTDARRRLTIATVRPEVRERQETEFRHLEDEQARANKETSAASIRIARLERIRRIAGSLAAHDDAASWLETHADAPVLAPDMRRRLTDARAALLNAGQLLERDSRDRQSLAEQTQAITVNSTLIAHAEAIEALILRVGTARQAERDIPRREAELAAAVERITVLMHQLNLSLPVERAAAAIPARAVVVRTRELAGRLDRIEAKLAQLPAEITAAAADLAETGAKLSALPAPFETGDLERLVREIRAPGDPETRAADAAKSVLTARAHLEAAVARAPGKRGDAAALIALPAQAFESYERLDEQRANSEKRWRDASQELDRLRRERAQDAQSLEQLAAGEPMPDSAAIAAARERREHGWCLIYRRAFTSDPPSHEQAQAWAGTVPLPLAYARSVTAADELADRRNHESERLAQAAELERRIALHAAAIETQEKRCADASAARELALSVWCDACTALGVAGEARLSEMAALLGARERAVEAHSNLTVAEDGQARLLDTHRAWQTRLATILGSADSDSLVSLLAVADDRIQACEQVEEARGRLRERLAGQEKVHGGKCAEQETARCESEKILQEWAEPRMALGRPADEHPRTTVALLDLFGDLDKEQRTASGLRVRLRQMKEERTAFRAEATELAKQAAPDLMTADGFEVATELHRRLDVERAAEARRNALADQLDRADATLSCHRDAHQRCADDLRTVIALIGADTVETAEARVAAAEERSRYQQMRDRAAEELARNGDGRSLEQLRAEVRSVSPDQITDELAQLHHEQEQANNEAQRLAGEIATRLVEMERQARDDQAQLAAVEQQAVLAQLDHVLEDAALLHLAGLLLQSSLDTVQAAGTSVLLTRIGQLFRTITGGAYLRIEAEDPGDGSARLMAVEQDFPDERKSVAELSEGSRDQLFLALRLAAVEEHVATAPPLPFVGDDILQTFDDERAAAAMRALVQLSDSTQVILLSHHRHLLSVADTLPAGQVHVCEIMHAAA